MPDLGRCGEVGDEKRSDSSGGFPRVVGAMRKWMKRERARKDEPRFDLKNTKLGVWHPHHTTTYTSR